MGKKLSILMQAWSVQTILNDLKTQTRRPIVPQPKGKIGVDFAFTHKFLTQKGIDLGSGLIHYGAGESFTKCRNGKVGDELYVKETYFAYGKWERTTAKTKKRGDAKWMFVDLTGKMSVKYFYADEPPKLVRKGISEKIGYYKRPGIYMPFRASRLGIKITDLRAEKIQSISSEDIEAEGIKPRPECWGLGHLKSALRHDFKKLWNSINEDRGFGWDSNGWVWAIRFEKFLLKNGEKNEN